jgi:hypothetical protein
VNGTIRHDVTATWHAQFTVDVKKRREKFGNDIKMSGKLCLLFSTDIQFAHHKISKVHQN